MKKKLLLYLMTAVLVLSLIPVTAFAQTVIVTNYDDLYSAVDSARDGDTIIIADRIQIDFGVFLGDDSKHITLKRSGNGCIEIVNSPMDDHWNIFFINLTFDCQGVPSEQFLVNSIDDQAVDINLQGCTFINTVETEEPEPSDPEPSEPTTEEPTDPEPTIPTEEGGDGQESGQEGSDDGQKDSDQGDEEKPTQDTQEGQERVGKGTQTPEPEQSTDTDTGTVSGNTNTDETTTSGTTASLDKKDDGTPTSETNEAPRTQTETPAYVTVTIVTDTGTSTINADDGQNIPVTVPVTTSDSTGQSGSITTGQGQTIEGVTVNGQPVTLPDGSGTVTINVVVESPTQEAEQGQVDKSESLAGTSEPTLTQPEQQQKGVDVVQVIQAVLLACILGFLIGDRVNRKKAVEKDAEMK